MRTLRLLIAALSWLCMGTAVAAVEANRASEAELDGVRGIGPGLSSRILAARQQAPFRDWADFISRVPGVGRSRAARLSAEGLTVDGLPYGVPAPAAPAASHQKP